MKSIFITGAKGFIGRHLVKQLQNKNDYKLILAGKSEHAPVNSSDSIQYLHFDIDNSDSFPQPFPYKSDIVIHLAGLAHNEQINSNQFYKTNTEGTSHVLSLARQMGVKQFIYISTVKVHGDDSPEQEVTEESLINPQDDYAISKYRAEQAVLEACADTGMQYVIIRPPLVYGPGVKGNFLRLLSIIDKKLPMPFGRFTSKRSYIYVDNLCKIIEILIQNQACRNKVYLVKDADKSTKDLITDISHAFGHSPTNFKVPVKLLEYFAILFNRKKDFYRLSRPMKINNSKLLEDLQWLPMVSQNEAIAKTINWYQKEYKKLN